MICQAGLMLGKQVRGALFTFIFVSPYVPQGARRSVSSLSMASASNVLGATPGWKSLIDENIKRNDVAHKNFGVWPHNTARTSACCAPSRLLSRKKNCALDGCGRPSLACICTILEIECYEVSCTNILVSNSAVSNGNRGRAASGKDCSIPGLDAESDR